MSENQQGRQVAPDIEPDQWPPLSCGMPLLTFDPSENWATLVLNVGFTKGLPTDYKAASFSKSFVRLTEVAATQYNEAREIFHQFLESGSSKAFALPLVVNHLEQCILALRRAIRFAKHPKGLQLSEHPVTSIDVDTRIRQFRNAIEHTDERITSGKISKGDANMLQPKSDRMELCGEAILYVELADWLQQLHRLARQVAAYNPSRAARPQP